MGVAPGAVKRHYGRACGTLSRVAEDVHEPDLLTLVEQEDFLSLYAIVDLDEVASAWLEYHRTEDDDLRDRLWWAVQLLFDDPDEERRRALILRLLGQSRDDDDIGTVAAGPLEAYLSDDPSTLHWVERQAATNERLRQALTKLHAWRLPDRAFARVEAAAGARLRRPDRDAYERRTGRA
jgi:hypothetical protein